MSTIDCTPRELAALVLDGDTSATLLRRCSPVQFIRGGDCPGVVVDFVDHKGHPNTPLVVWPSDAGWVGKPSLRSSISLDLTLSAGRLHAWLWSLEREGERAGVKMDPMPYMRADRAGIMASQREVVPLRHQHDGLDARHLFDDLDFADPRRLPDGSHWVDVEALRRHVLYVASFLTR